jgi:hypothetical protein
MDYGPRTDQEFQSPTAFCLRLGYRGLSERGGSKVSLDLMELKGEHNYFRRIGVPHNYLDKLSNYTKTKEDLYPGILEVAETYIK